MLDSVRNWFMYSGIHFDFDWFQRFTIGDSINSYLHVYLIPYRLIMLKTKVRIFPRKLKILGPLSLTTKSSLLRWRLALRNSLMVPLPSTNQSQRPAMAALSGADYSVAQRAAATPIFKHLGGLWVDKHVRTKHHGKRHCREAMQFARSRLLQRDISLVIGLNRN